MDGTFSIRLLSTSGSFTLYLTSFGITSAGVETPRIPGVVSGPVAAVPEPATLTLLGSGLAAAFLRRRKPRTH